MTLVYEKSNTRKIFFLLVGIIFIAFLFTSDGHRYTIDEWTAQEMAFRIVTLEPDPLYVQNESKHYFNYPIMNPDELGSLCSNAITCYPTSIFFSLTQVPFIAINHYFQIIDSNTLVLSTDDFVFPHYNFWRNSENVDIVFMQLFYGPFFSALSIGIFFLICLEHKFSRNNSILLSVLLAFSTMIWAYSNTSLNSVPTLLFVLLGYLFYKKFQSSKKSKFLIFSSIFFGYGFLIRTDVILFIVPIWFFLLISVLKRNTKIHSLLFYSAPLLFSYFGNKFVDSLRFIPSSSTSDGNISLVSDLPVFLGFFNYEMSKTLTGLFGLLFAPGVGLFIFCPLLLTVFFSFPDFFRKNKSECFLLLSFFARTLLYHSYLHHWHGLVAWGPRYLLLTIPFLIIPLGASLERRSKKFMLSLIIILGSLGVLFNLVYVLQDVSWFVWTQPGSHVGLFGLGTVASYLYIHDTVIWTFQYSQLTQSLLLMFEFLQHDVYLLHLFGTFVYFAILISSISILCYILWRVVKSSKMETANSQLSYKNTN